MAPKPSQALTKRTASNALMLPPPAPKRIKRPSIVLDEDTYVNAISHIIKRDYFPGLFELETQQEYLDAINSHDKEWIEEVGRKLTHIMTPRPNRRRKVTRRETGKTPVAGRGGETPRAWGGAETPVYARTEAGDEEEEEEKKPEVDLNLSLGAFQAKYTSEDQESFNQLLDRANLQRFEKYRHFHPGNALLSKRQIAQQKVIEARKDTSDTSTSTEIALRPSQDLDARPAAPNFARDPARNNLMFAPDSIEDRLQTTSQKSEAASNAGPKTVIHHNTRLPTTFSHENEPSRPPSPTLSAVRDAIAGRPRATASEAGFTARPETPSVNGYKFVPKDVPNPEPEAVREDLLEKIRARDHGPNPFRIDEASAREKLHMKMVDGINSKSRNGGSSGGGNGGLGTFAGETPRFLSAPRRDVGGVKGRGNLTPAARRLFERVGTPRNGGGGVFGGTRGGVEEGASRNWTPTPRLRRKV